MSEQSYSLLQCIQVITLLVNNSFFLSTALNQICHLKDKYHRFLHPDCHCKQTSSSLYGKHRWLGLDFAISCPIKINGVVPM